MLNAGVVAAVVAEPLHELDYVCTNSVSPCGGVGFAAAGCLMTLPSAAWKAAIEVR